MAFCIVGKTNVGGTGEDNWRLTLVEGKEGRHMYTYTHTAQLSGCPGKITLLHSIDRGREGWK